MRRQALLGTGLAAVGLVVPLVRAVHASQAPASGSHLSDPSSLAELTPLSAPTDALMTGAVEAFRRGDLSRARDLAARAVTAGRREAPLYKLLAVTEYLLGDAEQFEVHIRQALALAPKDADLHYHQARYLYEQKQYGEAAAAFERATTLSPDHYKARYYGGLVAEAMGQPDRALELFGDAIATIERLRVRYVWPHVDLGRLLVDRGDVDRGLGWLYRAVRTDPELPYGHYEYAKALLRRGPTADVERALLQAIRLDPGYASAYYVLARYYTKVGDEERAQQTLAKFKDVQANDVPSRYGVRR